MRVRSLVLTVLTCWLAFSSVAANASEARRMLVWQCQPAYPFAARQAGIEGTIVLSLAIEPDGHVGKVELESGPAIFVLAAESAVRRWQYTPASTETVTEVKVKFVL